MPKRIRRDAGFSLVELIATIAIIGVLASVASLRYRSGSSTFEHERLVEQTIADIRRARAHAIATGQWILVTCTFSPDGYTIPLLPSTTNPQSGTTVDFTTEGNHQWNSASFNGAHSFWYDPYGAVWDQTQSARLTTADLVLRSGSGSNVVDTTIPFDVVTGHCGDLP